MLSPPHRISDTPPPSLDETCIRDNDVAPEDVLQQNNYSSYSELLLKKLKSCLAGVPPPPRFTYPQQKLEDMLELLQNEDWINYESKTTGFLHEKMNCDQITEKTRPWPEVKNCIYFDICYNVNKTTEEVVNLCDIYRQRYVGCETSSFVTANSPSKYDGRKKERRKMCGRSPRRQNCTARRKKAFSSTSLKEACKTNLFGLAQRTIPMDGKTNQTETKRSLFLTADEQRRRRLALLKQSPGKAKTLWMQRKLTRKSTPRKLTPKKSGVSSQNTPKKGTTPRKQRTPRKSEVCRNLNENGKRNRSQLDSDEKTASYPISSDNSEPMARPSSELSQSQRRKLLWAVSAALGKVGIKQGHTNFRSYGKRLFRVCKHMWTNRSTEGAMNSSTSEKMLSMASEQLPAVMKEVNEGRKPENLDLFSQDSNSWDCFANNM